MASTKSRRVHAAYAADAAREATAIGYRVHFRKGPSEIYREDAADLAGAYDVAEAMNKAHGQHGRRAIIYALLPGGVSLAINQQTRPGV